MRSHSAQCRSKARYRDSKARIKTLEALRNKAEALPHDIIDALAPASPSKATTVQCTARCCPDAISSTSHRTRHRHVGGRHRRQHRRATSATNRQHQQDGPRQVLEQGADDLDRHRRRGDRHPMPRDFLIAVSRPVFDKVRADGGHKTTASMPLSRKRSASGCG